MYKVEYCSCLFGECETLDLAVSLALAVHRSSNVPHEVKVIRDCGLFAPDYPVIELTLKLDAVDHGKS